MGRTIKTFIIEDSALMRIMIADALRSDPQIEVIGTASNGKEGASRVSLMKPDVVITDMLMPQYDGLYAVKSIMQKNPTPIILLSSLKRSNPEIFDALNAGAFDFIDKPEAKGSEGFRDALKSLRDCIKSTNSLNVETLGNQVTHRNHHIHSFSDTLQYEIIVIGASTGGPSAVESILMQLPENLAVPVVIAQHMPERFLISYAKRLSDRLPLKVEVATEDSIMVGGTIYILPGDGNMGITKNEQHECSFRYVRKRYDHFNNPSVDCLFETVSECYGSKSIGVILTGMGKDGAEGLHKIKQKGGLTIGQNAATSVVNGMPLAAKNLGAVDNEMALKDIAGFIVSCF